LVWEEDCRLYKIKEPLYRSKTSKIFRIHLEYRNFIDDKQVNHSAIFRTSRLRCKDDRPSVVTVGFDLERDLATSLSWLALLLALTVGGDSLAKGRGEK